MTAYPPKPSPAEAETAAALARLLREEGLALAVRTAAGQTLRLHGRGVSDLRRLTADPTAPLRGATVADKVVGKGAAALMAAGGVRALHAAVISRPALELLGREGVAVACDATVPHIIRRDGRGVCPVEAACAGTDDVAGCLAAIDRFFARMAGGDGAHRHPDTP